MLVSVSLRAGWRGESAFSDPYTQGGFSQQTHTHTHGGGAAWLGWLGLSACAGCGTGCVRMTCSAAVGEGVHPGAAGEGLGGG